jgi:hypothetical protein
MKSWKMHRKPRSVLSLCTASRVITVAQRKEVGGATYLYLENMFGAVIVTQLKNYIRNCEDDVRS